MLGQFKQPKSHSILPPSYQDSQKYKKKMNRIDEKENILKLNKNQSLTFQPTDLEIKGKKVAEDRTTAMPIILHLLFLLLSLTMTKVTGLIAVATMTIETK